jgi:hypothetical protein
VVKIGNKITKQTYGNSEKTKLFGAGQGSGNSPFIWTLISSEMIKIYDKYAKGAEYKDPQDKYTTNLKMTAYVDDINAHMTHNKNQTNKQIKQEIKRNAIIWEMILYITGGKLSATICTFYINKLKFSTTSRPNHNSTKADSITIQTHSEDIKITGISTDTYHKSLGYLQLIGKTRQKQVETINKKWKIHLLK